MSEPSPELDDMRLEIQKLKEQIDQIEVDQFDLQDMLHLHSGINHYAETVHFRE